MSAVDLHPASRFSFAELAALFTRGYEGYFVPVTLAADEFEHMALTGDFDLEASCVLMEGEAPVAFALLGVRGARGWVGGMGVVGGARGHGLGRIAMESVVASARALGVHVLDLEVLEQNVHAAGIYETLGFRDRRRLDVWVREPAAAAAGGENAPARAGAAEALSVEECLELHGAFHRERSPWQRDLDSLRHWAPRLSAIGIREAGGGIRGWVLYRSAPGRLSLADLAVAPGAPIAPMADVLGALFAAHAGSTTLLVNLPPEDPFSPLLRELGATVKFRQREMTLTLV
jgi:ribosomal protein S18 acetylase RimI-like enzyme